MNTKEQMMWSNDDAHCLVDEYQGRGTCNPSKCKITHCIKKDEVEGVVLPAQVSSIAGFINKLIHKLHEHV